jgi:hypothetical protein
VHRQGEGCDGDEGVCVGGRQAGRRRQVVGGRCRWVALHGEGEPAGWGGGKAMLGCERRAEMSSARVEGVVSCVVSFSDSGSGDLACLGAFLEDSGYIVVRCEGW